MAAASIVLLVDAVGDQAVDGGRDAADLGDNVAVAKIDGGRPDRGAVDADGGCA